MSGDATDKPTTAAEKPAQGGASSKPPAPPASPVSTNPPSVPPKKPAGSASPTSAAGATKVAGSKGSSASQDDAKASPATTTGPSKVGTVTMAAPTTAPPSGPRAPSGAQQHPAPAATTTQATPAVKKAAAGPRRVRLAVARVDPWSAMKLSFLLSIALGIMMIVATIVFWMVLDGMYVFTEVDRLVKEIVGDAADVNVLQYVEFKRVVSLATIIAIIDIILLTALATIGAFLYNVVASLVGGVHLTLIDE